jgi:hypothetical protein
MATASSPATGAASSGVPSIAGLKFNPTAVGGFYFATDPNNSHYQVGVNPTTGVYSYSNPYTGVFANGNSLGQAVQNYEQQFGNAPLQTIQGILNGNAFSKPTAATTATSATSASTTSTAPATTDDLTSLLDTLLPSLIGSNNADPSTQDTQQPEVLPTTSGGGTTAASPVIPLLLIGVAIALGFWWWKTHHKKHAAAE